MSTSNGAKHLGPPPGAHLYTRDGFVGKMCVALRPHTIYEYSSVEGPHAPKRLQLREIVACDRDDASALPTLVASSRSGVTLSVSARVTPTPYVFRNAECDELHFIQEGALEYLTDFGVLRVEAGDFVALGRAVSYRVKPLSKQTLRVVIETPEVINLNPPAPFGMVNFGRDLKRPVIEPIEDGQTSLWIKSFDGITRFVVPRNPLSCKAIIDGVPPVWKLSLEAISPLAYPNSGGPPAQFAQTPTGDLMVYSLSARPPTARPPQHHNADYDELIFYFGGAGAYGAISDPGTMTWTPKGVTHWGPEENVAEGYWAWLLESKGTFRLADAGQAAARALETGQFGIQEAPRSAGKGS